MKIQIHIASVLSGEFCMISLLCVWLLVCHSYGWRSVVYCEDAGFKFSVEIVVEGFGLLNSRFSKSNLNKLPPMVGMI